jgi:hypothetical protein
MKKILLSLLCILFAFGINAQTITFTSHIASSSDDAEETEDGTEVDISSSDLELVYDGNNQTVGVRFIDVTVPSDANIVSAYIQFTADGDYDETTNLTIKGESVESSLAFEEIANNISSRQTTSSLVNWDDILPWTDLEAGELQQTPDLTSIVSEIITSNNWQAGNPITFIFSGYGKRKAFSYDGSVGFAAELIIVYNPDNPIYNDLGIEQIVKPHELIFTNEEVEIEIEILNLGISSQSEYEVSYSINDEPSVTEVVSSVINTGESLNYTFVQTANMGEAGEYEIDVEVILAGDENLSNNSLSSTTTAVLNNDSLFFDQGSTWKYLDDGSDQGTDWQNLSFDDSQWVVGEGHMGFGEGDETTVLTSGYITYYFRKIVNIPDTGVFENIYFNIVHDDGAVAYVNGNEVLRSALMPAGTINYLTGTTSFIPNDVENDFWHYSIDKSYFQNGENIIAIEIHNQQASSSDISFDCSVSDTLIIDYKLDGPYVFYRNGEVIVKTVESTGPQTYVYNSPEEANLICRFQNGIDSFEVQIQQELNIEPCIYDLPEKFLAISDIEGNLEAFVMVLQDAGIMDTNYNWTFDNGHLFFVGDMFDRGNNVVECLWLLYRLESQAEALGGKIHFVAGNHDIMNLIFDFRYVAQKYYINTQLMNETLESIYATDTELGRWLRTKNIIEKVEPFIFLHGGISPEVDALNLSYDQINYWGRYIMDSVCQSNDCEIINGGSDYGIYWYRDMAEEVLSQQQVDTIISNFDGEMVVLGHTVFDNITLLYDEKVICIDLDHKDNFNNGYVSALYYEDGNLYDFYTDGANQTYTLLKTITSIDDPLQHTNKLNIEVFPNPTNSNTTIKYTVPLLTSHGINYPFVSLNIFNNMGDKVKSLVNKSKIPGTYYIEFYGNELKSGIYYYQISVGNYNDTGKIIITH